MYKDQPIIWLEDDQGDFELMEVLVKELVPDRKLLTFDRGQKLLQHLRETREQPFLILSDINMPGMTGFEVRQVINADEVLRKKAVPFIFFSTTADQSAVNRAYEMTYRVEHKIFVPSPDPCLA